MTTEPTSLPNRCPRCKTPYPADVYVCPECREILATPPPERKNSPLLIGFLITIILALAAYAAYLAYAWLVLGRY